MKVAVVGATGLVGSTMLQILAERDFPLTQLIPIASQRSVGKTIKYKETDYPVVDIEQGIAMQPDIALFSAGGNTSLEWAEKFAAASCVVIDNSSAWRMDPGKKLVVPEVNGHVLTAEDRIIANPNCSTIQMVMVLNPLHRAYGIKRVVVSTYQSVTGSGQKGVDHLLEERKAGNSEKPFYPHPIDLNVIPHIDSFLENGYTKEETKMILETQKIMGDDQIRVTATTVRVPVMGGHSESVNIEFEQPFDIDSIKELLTAATGIELFDDPARNHYPTPLKAFGNDEVWVGRIRRDESVANGLNCWIVADNLRKGAATNAIQIAEYLIENKIIHNSTLIEDKNN
ncbi:MAG: aspartate-semialdehyde dehydrogenase [Sphingobacteriales bacterium]|nr:MAG: aspartate-semialdehyde dehydrogenase [Sphingobacteriales bacterium]